MARRTDGQVRRAQSETPASAIAACRTAGPGPFGGSPALGICGAHNQPEYTCSATLRSSCTAARRSEGVASQLVSYMGFRVGPDDSARGAPWLDHRLAALKCVANALKPRLEVTDRVRNTSGQSLAGLPCLFAGRILFGCLARGIENRLEHLLWY